MAFNNDINSSYSNEVRIIVYGNWTKICARAYTSVGIKNNGILWSWGYNYHGQLGIGNRSDRNTPCLVGTDLDWRIIKGGTYYSLACKNDGTLWGWGRNEAYQLGLGYTTSATTAPYGILIPTQIGYDTDWSLCAGGGSHSMALKTNNTIWGWGKNDYGQLGIGNTINKYTPYAIVPDSDWSFIATGGNSSIAIKTNQTMWSWGSNGYGELGLGYASTKVTTPTQIIIGTDSDWSFVSIGGNNFSIAIMNNNTMWSWGRYQYGQLGLGDSISRYTPAQIGTESDWCMVSSESIASVALKTSGTMWSWGRNNYGQLGIGVSGDTTNRNTPTQIGINSDWIDVSGGVGHFIAVKTNKTLWSWGYNANGQLGLGDSGSPQTNRNTPTLIGE